MSGGNGIFYGVSVGPGDPELMTLKAVKVLEKVPVIATPQTSSTQTLAYDIACQVVDLSQKELIKLDFLMTRDQEKMRERHVEIADHIIKKLKLGQDVAMLNLGDVSIYSTFSYIMDIVKEQGFLVEIVAGVPSFCAVAATLQTSLTTMQQPLHIMPAGSLEGLLPVEGAKIVMKTGKSMEKVKGLLEEQEELQIMAVENCGLQNEKIYRSLEEIEENAGYFTTILIK